jgi:hypothetical protein
MPLTKLFVYHNEVKIIRMAITNKSHFQRCFLE